MSYPFYLGESLAAAASSRDEAALINLVKRNFEVIMNTHSQSGTMRKLRVAQLEALISRAVYRAGADPDRVFETSMRFLEQISKLRVRQREELRNTLTAFCSCLMQLIPDFPRSHPSLLERFLNVMEQDKEGKLTVEQVARKLSMSPSHLSRVIKMATGRSPSEYIRASKLRRARERLASASVTQAALESGFGKVSSFIALFRKYQGETPGVYKRRLALHGEDSQTDLSQISGIPSSKEGIVPRNGSVG